MLPMLASLFGGGAGASTVGSMIPGILGTLGGAFGNQSSKSFQMAGPSATGIAGENAILQNLSQMQNYTDMGPGGQDISAGVNSQRDFASMLQNYSQGGFLPGQDDWNTANQFAQQAFQPQQVMMNQSFEQNKQRTAQLAAQLGRPVNDPILQAKLAQEQMQGAERLGASQSAYASQFAQQLPQQRLGYAGQAADIKNNLASQAMANRQALIGIGSNLQQSDRQFRLGSATQNSQQGGGKQGEIAGFLAGGGKAIGQMFANSIFGSGGQQGVPSYNPNQHGDEWNMGFSGGGGQQQGGGGYTQYNSNNFPQFARPQSNKPFNMFHTGLNY